MIQAIAKTKTAATPFNVEPLLDDIIHDAQKEHQQFQEAFEVMGWEDLPDALKMEIKDDVTAKVDELQGRYSTCDSFVEKRRQRVCYWVDAFRDDMCSVDTAINALKVTTR